MKPVIQQSRFKLNKDSLRGLLKKELQNPNEKLTKLYRHQIEAVLTSADYFDDGSRSKNIGLLQVPTGGGKSGIIALLPYALGSNKVMVLSPGKVITSQLELTFGGKHAKESFYFKMGMLSSEDINSFVPDTYTINSNTQLPEMSRYDLVVVNAQKFARSAKPEIILNGEHKSIPADIFNNFDTIIVDEAHHYPANTWADIVQIFNKNGNKIIFLTATPNPKAEHLYDTIFQIHREELESLHIIRKLKFVPQEFGEIDSAELELIAMKMKNTLLEHDMVAENVVHKAMVLVKKDKEFTVKMANDFNAVSDLNLRTTFCTSDKGSERNLAIFNENNEKFRIMVVCQRLTEGYDNSNVSVCVILRNIGSDILFNQFVGRCIRISHDRKNPKDADITATIFCPKVMWDRYERNATENPDDNDDD